MNARASFWARRRAAVEAEARADAQAAEDAQRADLNADRDDAEILEEMGLSNPATLQKGDDFAAFMSREVPEHLRKQALRSLWRSNPVLACLDGLNDYDEDFRAGAASNGPLRTAYQVGKGLTAHVDEMARQAAAREAACDAVDEAVAHDQNAVTDEPEADAMQPEEEADMMRPEESAAHVAKAGQSADAAADAPAARRMRFRFAEAQT